MGQKKQTNLLESTHIGTVISLESHPTFLAVEIIITMCYNQFDKLEFVGVNDENFIYDWWHYGSWKNNCVPTAQTGFTEQRIS